MLFLLLTLLYYSGAAQDIYVGVETFSSDRVVIAALPLHNLLSGQSTNTTIVRFSKLSSSNRPLKLIDHVELPVHFVAGIEHDEANTYLIAVEGLWVFDWDQFHLLIPFSPSMNVSQIVGRTSHDPTNQTIYALGNATQFQQRVDQLQLWDKNSHGPTSQFKRCATFVKDPAPAFPPCK